MRKNFRRRALSVVSLMLATVAGVSTFASCAKKKDKEEAEQYENAAADYIETEYGETLHRVTVTPNPNRTFIRNGGSEYKVVYGGAVALQPVGFIINQLEAASGVVLEKVSVSDVASASGKYIFVGCDDLFASAGFSIENEDLRTSGYSIQSKGDSVFIQAKASEGYHLGAIAFLRNVVGYDMISGDMVIFENKAETLPDMDIVERPDFEYRNFTNNLANIDQIYGQGFNSAIFINIGSRGTHNVFEALPPSTYYNEHPGWYSGPTGSQQQLCYTAHGDADEYELMLETVYNKIKESVEADPDKNNIQFTHADNVSCCTCDDCTRIARRYGGENGEAISATIVKFINDLDTKLRADIDNGNVKGRKPGDIIHIWYFAYWATINPPILPTPNTRDDLQYCRSNKDVGVILAPISANFTKTFKDEENQRFAKLMTEWSNVCSNIMTWIYECNFNHYMYPYNTFDTIIENYRFCHSVGSMIMYNQGIRQNAGSTAFVRFREYLASKAQFDLRVNYKDVQKKFFDNYFREASDIMLDLFNQEMTWVNYLENTNAALNGGIYEPIEQAEWWPYATLRQWERMTQDAYRAVSKYESIDKELYNKLIDHIKLESLCPRYILLKLYGLNYSSTELLELRKQFKEDCIHFGITSDREHGEISALWKTWGID